jgi:hypothetical protein
MCPEAQISGLPHNNSRSPLRWLARVIAATTITAAIMNIASGPAGKTSKRRLTPLTLAQLKSNANPRREGSCELLHLTP